MARDPYNNPTERILRMIEEWREVVDWIESFELPPRPKTPALDEEILRQKVTKAHTESQRDFKLRLYNERQRLYMRNVRELGREHGLPASKTGLIQGLAERMIAEGETLPTPIPVKAKPVKMSREEKELHDAVMGSMPNKENWDAGRAAIDELLKPQDNTGLSPEEIAQRDLERAQAFAKKAASGGLFKKEENDG